MDPCEDKWTWQRFAWRGGDAQEKRREEGGRYKRREEREKRKGRWGEEEREGKGAEGVKSATEGGFLEVGYTSLASWACKVDRIHDIPIQCCTLGIR